MRITVRCVCGQRDEFDLRAQVRAEMTRALTAQAWAHACAVDATYKQRGEDISEATLGDPEMLHALVRAPADFAREILA